MSVPKYCGRLLDKLVVIVAQQTANVKGNPDEADYVTARGLALERVTWALWEARDRLQRRRREKAKLPAG